MAWKNRVLELRQVRAAELKQNPRNFRRHPERQSKALRGVLEEIGIAGALLAYNHPERGLELIDGHLRQEQGGVWPVLVLDVTENEANILLATHDPIGAMAEQDANILRELVSILEVENTDLAAMLEEMTPAKIANTANQDDVPEIQTNPISKHGDVWLLDSHKVYCADSTQLSPPSADCLIFDPPWDVPAALQKPQGSYKSILAFTDGRRIGDVVSLFGAPTWLFTWDCVSSWYTPNRPLQRAKHCLWYGDVEKYDPDGSHYGDSGDTRTVSNTRGSYKFVPDPRGKHLSDVFSHPITKLHSESEHSHSKPVDWMRMLLGNTSTGTIYDPFLGSGTSLIAAEQLKRSCYGVELNPQYVDLVIRRWQNFTGHQATLEATGQTFAQVEVSRGR